MDTQANGSQSQLDEILNYIAEIYNTSVDNRVTLSRVNDYALGAEPETTGQEAPYPTNGKLDEIKAALEALRIEAEMMNREIQRTQTI